MGLFFLFCLLYMEWKKVRWKKVERIGAIDILNSHLNGDDYSDIRCSDFIYIQLYSTRYLMTKSRTLYAVLTSEKPRNHRQKYQCDVTYLGGVEFTLNATVKMYNKNNGFWLTKANWNLIWDQSQRRCMPWRHIFLQAATGATVFTFLQFKYYPSDPRSVME